MGKIKQKIENYVLLDIISGLRKANRKLTMHNTELMSENVELKEKIAKLEEDNSMLRIYVDERFTPDLYADDATHVNDKGYLVFASLMYDLVRAVMDGEENKYMIDIS